MINLNYVTCLEVILYPQLKLKRENLHLLSINLTRYFYGKLTDLSKTCDAIWPIFSFSITNISNLCPHTKILDVDLYNPLYEHVFSKGSGPFLMILWSTATPPAPSRFYPSHPHSQLGPAVKTRLICLICLISDHFGEICLIYAAWV